VSDCGLMPSEQLVIYTMAKTSYIWRDDIRFVLDQHT